jgi:hypothetical protein
MLSLQLGFVLLVVSGASLSPAPKSRSPITPAFITRPGGVNLRSHENNPTDAPTAEGVEGACQQLEITGTTHWSAGTWDLVTDNSCAGRPLYSMISGLNQGVLSYYYFGHTGQTWGGYMTTDDDGICGTTGYVYSTDASATSLLEGSTGAWIIGAYLSSSGETDATYTVTCLDTEPSDDDADESGNDESQTDAPRQLRPLLRTRVATMKPMNRQRRQHLNRQLCQHLVALMIPRVGLLGVKPVLTTKPITIARALAGMVLVGKLPGVCFQAMRMQTE